MSTRAVLSPAAFSDFGLSPVRVRHTLAGIFFFWNLFWFNEPTYALDRNDDLVADHAAVKFSAHDEFSNLVFWNG